MFALRQRAKLCYIADIRERGGHYHNHENRRPSRSGGTWFAIYRNSCHRYRCAPASPILRVPCAGHGPGNALYRRRQAHRPGPFGALIEQIVRDCSREVAELKSFPLDAISQSINPDDAQDAALKSIRRMAGTTADTLAPSTVGGSHSVTAARRAPHDGKSGAR
jgi:hypothetical protein